MIYICYYKKNTTGFMHFINLEYIVGGGEIT